MSISVTKLSIGSVGMERKGRSEAPSTVPCRRQRQQASWWITSRDCHGDSCSGGLRGALVLREIPPTTSVAGLINLRTQQKV